MIGSDPEQAALEEMAQKLRSDSLDSLQLLSCLNDNPICSVQVDADVPCVAVVWKRYATSMQLRFVHENILALLKQHSLRALLGDDTALPTIHVEDRRWITESWLPRATAAGLVVIANVKPTAPWAQAAVSSVQGILARYMNIGSFEDWETARAWLRNAAAVAARGPHPVADPLSPD
jgi:hypothetical protein